MQVKHQRSRIRNDGVSRDALILGSELHDGIAKMRIPLSKTAGYVKLSAIGKVLSCDPGHQSLVLVNIVLPSLIAQSVT